MRDANKGKEEAVQQIIGLRDEIKQLKKEDKVRYKEVYSTLINSLNSENAVPRTNFYKDNKVEFRYPKAPNKLDQYKVEQHRYYLGTPINLDKKRHKKHTATIMSLDGPIKSTTKEISIDTPRINSPPEAGSSSYFNNVRRVNAGRLKQLKDIEHKQRGFYDQIDEFIKNDQVRMENARFAKDLETL